MFVYINLPCDNIRLNRIIIDSPDPDVLVIPSYGSVTSLIFLDVIWFKTGTSDDYRYIPIQVLASVFGLSICCLLPAIHTVSECNFISSFSHILKVATFQILKKIK